jgi:hypothetical protein
MTISDSYLMEQKQLHENPNYGVASLSFAPIVSQLIKQTGYQELSDYGAGKQNLHKALVDLGHENLSYLPYDPAFPDYGPPKPGQLVCCIDVLEHVEPEFLTEVLNDLKAITQKVGFFTVHTGPAVKTLSDGRNAHIIQQPSSWWLPKLCEHFEIQQLQSVKAGFWVIVKPRIQS